MPEIFDRLKASLAERYHLERELGTGGLAIVYLAEDLKHRREVAVKGLRRELAAPLGAERLTRRLQPSAPVARDLQFGNRVRRSGVRP